MRLGLRMQIAVRIVNELRPAPRAAEMIGPAAQLMMVRHRLRIDGHAADRILHRRRLRLGGMIVMAMSGVMMGVHSAILLDEAADSASVDPHMVFDTMSESSLAGSATAG